MEHKETLRILKTQGMMLEDIEYYKYIFKKTEKMACAVFYILRGEMYYGQKDTVVSDLELSVQTLLTASLQSLRSNDRDREDNIWNLKYTLIDFESKLRVANAARFLPSELLEVFLHEVDSVQRSLRKYVEPRISNPLETIDRTPEPIREKRSVQKKIGQENVGVRMDTDTATHTAVPQSRRERVLMVLKDNNEATIKDIVEVITDCSEKTIQRELISLIKDNVVSREGERRWSKYRLV